MPYWIPMGAVGRQPLARGEDRAWTYSVAASRHNFPRCCQRIPDVEVTVRLTGASRVTLMGHFAERRALRQQPGPRRHD
jgi:hypothetical protein